MNRILVLGSSGAGKTTFSKELAKILSIKLYHLDSYFWQPGWVQTELDEWNKITDSIMEEKEWIMDGNYFNNIENRILYADTVIYLDKNRFICLWRIFFRILRNFKKNREELPEGCPEKFSWSFIEWVWNFNKKYRPYLIKLISGYKKEKEVIILSKKSEIKQYLNSF